MTNPQKKKKNSEILEVWGSLKEKITVLLSDLDSFKSNQEQIIERYEKRIREKQKKIEEWERDYKELNELVMKVRREVVGSGNVSRQLVLDILNRRR